MVKDLKKLQKIKGFLFDMDGTLVNYNNEPFHSTWDAFIPLLTKEKREKWIYLRNFYSKRGEEKFKEWFDKQVSLLKGISVVKAKEILFPIPYTKGAYEFLNFLKKNRKEIYTGIVTGGIDIVVEEIDKEFSLDFVIYNKLDVKKGIFSGRGKCNINVWKKEKGVYEFSKKFNLKLDEICYFGDNKSDIKIFKLVGVGIAINPKHKEVSCNADYSFKNFYELLKLKIFQQK